jgi:hypothetical protein
MGAGPGTRHRDPCGDGGPRTVDGRLTPVQVATPGLVPRISRSGQRRAEHVVRVHDGVRVPLLGEEGLPLGGVLGVDGVADATVSKCAFRPSPWAATVQGSGPAGGTAAVQGSGPGRQRRFGDLRPYDVPLYPAGPAGLRHRAGQQHLELHVRPRAAEKTVSDIHPQEERTVRLAPYPSPRDDQDHL